MSSRRLITVITLPWLAAALVLLLITKLRDDHVGWHWGLFGSAAICFSIGCLARTSVMLAEQKQRQGEQGQR
ncbi:MAG: hypothetical protein VKN17_04275 [Cyanobacteriota bacterium]|nr:hypothetical protein [Cyanobacteriota bacterium]